MGCCSGEKEPVPMQERIRKGRSCTDCLCFLVWIIFTAAWVFVSVMAFRYGNTDYLMFGVDYEGNVCGKEVEPGGGVPGTPTVADLADNLYGSDWASRSKIWYPLDETLFTDPQDITSNLKKVLHLGICVDECPMPNGKLLSPNKVKWYRENREWDVWYASRNQTILNRCIPDLDHPNTSAIVKVLAQQFRDNTGIGSMWQYLEAELFDGKWVLLIGIGTGVLLCFVWIFFLKFTVSFFVYLVLILVFVLFAGGSFLLFWRAEHVALNAAPDDPWRDYITVMRICGGVAAAAAVIFFLLVIFMWKRIMVAIEILKLSADVITTTPTIVLMPVISVFFIVADVLYALFIGILLYSAVEVVPDQVTINAPWLKPLLNSTGHITNLEDLINQGLDVTNITNETLNISNINTSVTFNATTIKETWNLKFIFQIFNLFEFLWTMGLINAIGFMTIAFVTVLYYFSAPGDKKKAPVGATFTGLWWTIRYHLGTVAMGSFIIAVVQMIRIIAAYIQEKIEQSQNDAAKWIGRCIQCYLACLERIITYINKNAYIICCIESSSFCPSAATAVGLLLSNLADISASNFISDAIFIFCKICITGINVLIMWALYNTGLVTDSKVLVLPLVLGGFISWTLASVFMHVYDAVQDTALMCYCWDKEHNNGTEDSPYYFNDRLQSILNKFNDHRGRSTRKVVPTDEE